MPSLGSSEPIVVATIAFAVGLLLVVTFLVATLRQAVVSGQLSQLFQSKMRREVVARREAEILGDAIRIQRALDAQAFATHQQMLRIAREHSTDQ